MPVINYQYSGQFAPNTYVPIFDPTGTNPSNLITGEKQTITGVNGNDYHVIVPLFAPFFASDLSISIQNNNSNRLLIEGIDYVLAYQFIGASRGCSKAVYGAISFINNNLSGEVSLNSYRTIGGHWTLNIVKVNELLSNQVQNPRTTSWEQIVQLPSVFPVIDHEWDLTDLVGARDIVSSIDSIGTAIAAAAVHAEGVEAKALVELHTLDKNNPHDVTAADVGLNNVLNYGIASDTESLVGEVNNKYSTPHGVSIAVDKHKQELDPHPQYWTIDRGEAALNNKLNIHKTAIDPHGDRAYTDSKIELLRYRVLGNEDTNFLNTFLIAQDLAPTNQTSNITSTDFLQTFISANT